MNGWRQEAKRTIREYPELRSRANELRSQSIVPRYSSSGGGSGGESRPVEMAALRELPQADERRLRSVELAIETTKRYPDSDNRLKAIGMLYWSKHTDYNMQAVAQTCHVHEQTAKSGTPTLSSWWTLI